MEERGAFTTVENWDLMVDYLEAIDSEIEKNGENHEAIDKITAEYRDRMLAEFMLIWESSGFHGEPENMEDVKAFLDNYMEYRISDATMPLSDLVLLMADFPEE